MGCSHAELLATQLVQVRTSPGGSSGGHAGGRGRDALAWMEGTLHPWAFDAEAMGDGFAQHQAEVRHALDAGGSGSEDGSEGGGEGGGAGDDAGTDEGEDGDEDNEDEDDEDEDDTDDDDDDDDDDEEENARARTRDTVAAARLVYPLDGVADERKRFLLLEKIRCNTLGFYTNSEQFCYPLSYQRYSGSGLYVLGSVFNHSCAPNVTRFSIGDVTCFVAMEDVAAGEELCICYIEPDLCAEDSRMYRAMHLARDFVCACRKCSRDSSAEPQAFRQDADALIAAQDFSAVDDAFAEVDTERLAAGCSPAGAIVRMGEALQDPRLPQRDRQDLRNNQTIALIHAGRHAEALGVVVQSLAWLREHVHPSDESQIPLLILAAMCRHASAPTTVQAPGPPGAGAGPGEGEGPPSKRRKVAAPVGGAPGAAGSSAGTVESFMARALDVHTVNFGAGASGGGGTAAARWFAARYVDEVAAYCEWFHGRNAARKRALRAACFACLGVSCD